MVIERTGVEMAFHTWVNGCHKNSDLKNSDFRPQTLESQTSKNETSEPENSDSENADPENSDPENSDLSKLKKKLNSSYFLSPKMFYGHALFIGKSQKGARYSSSLVYCCRVDQTVKN